MTEKLNPVARIADLPLEPFRESDHYEGLDCSFGRDSYKVHAGDVLAAPRGGADYAHKLTNTGSVPLKYLSISTMADTEICEYPDSGKFLASTRNAATRKEHFRFIGREDSGVDYWDGENSAD